MATQIQYRRGTNAQNAAFTGALAEITVDTTNGTLRVHDGITAGGSNIATVGYVTAQIGALSANSISSGTSNVRVVSSGGNVTTSVGGTANVIVAYSGGVSITGDLSVTGNATLSGNILGDRIQNGTTQIDIQTPNGNANITVGGTSNVAVFATTGTFITGLTSVTGNITGGNISATNHTGTTVSVTGAVTGASVVGGVITGSSVSVTGAVTGASLVGTITTASQTNITSVGTLGSLSVTANVQGGNLRTAGLVSATGSITGASVVGGVITGSSVSVTGAQTAASTVGGVMTGSSVSVTGTINGTTVTGTSLTVSTGNITGGNLILSGAITDSGQLDISTTASNSNIVLTPNGTGNVNTGANISVAGRVTAASTVGGVITGSSSSVTGAQTAASTVGGVITGSSVSVTGAVTSASVVGGVMSGSSLTVTTGTITGGNIVNGNGNGVGNIGSSSTYFNTVFAKATSAQYADLAEMYLADSDYTPGTVLDFGGTEEVTSTTRSHSTQVAGIVSTTPSYLMNSTLTGINAVEVALVGRVPCHVVGTIAKGDRLVASSTPGVATRLDMSQYQPGCIIGKALEAYDSETVGTIEVAVGRI
jgi:hypothetical protein